MSKYSEDFAADMDAVTLREASQHKARHEADLRALNTSNERPQVDPKTTKAVARVFTAWKPLAWTRMTNTTDVRRGLTDAVTGAASTIPLAQYAQAADKDVLSSRNLDALARRLDKHPIAHEIRRLAAATTLPRAIAANGADLSQASIAYYGMPTNDTLALARSILTNQPVNTPTSPTWSAANLAHVTRAVLNQGGLGDWTVKLDDHMLARMSVKGSARTVKIATTQLFTIDDVRRLLVHEIGGHVFQFMNSAAQPDALAKLGSHPITNEGLALLVEERLGVMQREHMQIYAARAIAVDLAPHAGAVDIARSLAPQIGTERAVDTALRVKRGLTDIDQPGVFAKDHAYLAGYEMIKDLVGTDEANFAALFATKWPAAHLPTVRQMLGSGQLARPLYVPDHRFGEYVASVIDQDQ